MKNLLALALILFTVQLCLAQSATATLDYNDTEVVILNGGDFFWDLSSSGYEVPKSSGQSKSTIHSGAIWISGIDTGGKLHLAASTYRQRGSDFAPGPTSNDPENTRNNYDKIYVVTRYQIEQHILNPQNPPNDLRNWPGNGDTTKGEPWQLAPFVDVNKNGKYEPLSGDYPKIKGEQAAYCIYNDNTIHAESGGEPLNVDIHQMFYQEYIGTLNGLLDHVNLAYFKVVNRSKQDYKDVRFGVFVDFDLGNYMDDHVGTDTVLKMIYAYNGDDHDEGVNGYGYNPPAQSMIFLNNKLYSSFYYINYNDPIRGNPNVPMDYYNYMLGNHKLGERFSFTVGKDTIKPKYIFAGDPVKNELFTQENLVNSPADVRILGTAEPFDLAPGESKCIDIAFVYGRSEVGRLASISVMKNNAYQVKELYNNDVLGWKSFGCEAGSGFSTVRALPETVFSVYPNPTSSQIKIKSDVRIEKLVLYGLDGKVLKTFSPLDTQLDLSDVPSGVYSLQVNNSFKKVVKL